MNKAVFKTSKKAHLAAAAIALVTTLIFVSGPATAQLAGHKDDGTREFALIGDAPYDGNQRKEFVNMMKAIDAADLGFVVHTGDFWFDGIAWKKTTKGLPPCGDEVFSDRLGLAENSRHPFILTPGDNDWTDCYRAKPRAYDPLERLAKLRQMFFQGDKSLGKHKLRLTRQSEDKRYAKFRENVRWTYGGAQFATLHMTGSNNNLGRSKEMDEEYAERNAANLAWLRTTFEQAIHNGSRAIMLISQADPQFETKWAGILQRRYLLGGLGIKPIKEERITGFDDFLAELEEQTLAFGKPVVYVHGDTHTFRIDKPLVRTPGGKRFIENFTRVEVFGYPNTHWIRVTIVPGDPNVFRFTQEIVPENRVK